jgi:hypothetical protein
MIEKLFLKINDEDVLFREIVPLKNVKGLSQIDLKVDEVGWQQVPQGSDVDV